MTLDVTSFLIREREWYRQARERELERRLPTAVDWSPDIKWAPELTIRGASYPVRSLFTVEPSGPNVNLAKPGQLAASPSGAFVYCEKVVPRGEKLETIYGLRVGNVMFDAPVIVPALHERQADRYRHLPWMSLTPMEYITLRGGTKRAKGDVIVAGLGLGHQLIEVSRRPSVRRLMLVEHSQELCDWLLPRITPHLGRPLDDVIVGDAYTVMPRLSADVALVDIFSGYGGNGSDRDRLRRHCRTIKFIWAWGAAGS